jgi:hypothetical protein
LERRRTDSSRSPDSFPPLNTLSLRLPDATMHCSSINPYPPSFLMPDRSRRPTYKKDPIPIGIGYDVSPMLMLYALFKTASSTAFVKQVCWRIVNSSPSLSLFPVPTASPHRHAFLSRHCSPVTTCQVDGIYISNSIYVILHYIGW